MLQILGGRGISNHEWDPVYSMLIDEGIISVKETRTVYKYADNDDGSSKLVPSDEKTVYYYIIEKGLMANGVGQESLSIFLFGMNTIL